MMMLLTAPSGSAASPAASPPAMALAAFPAAEAGGAATAPAPVTADARTEAPTDRHEPGIEAPPDAVAAPDLPADFEALLATPAGSPSPAPSSDLPAVAAGTMAPAGPGAAGTASPERAAAPPPPAPAPVPVPAEAPRESVRWQSEGGLQEARLSLAPEGLGAIEMHVQVDEGAVRLHVEAVDARTRDLLSEGLPRLRERLGDSGLSLGQASVSTPQDQQRGGGTAFARSGSARASTREVEGVAAPTIRRGQGLLDHYA